MSAVDLPLDRDSGTVMVSYDRENGIYDFYGYTGLRPSKEGMRQLRASRPGQSVIFVSWDDLDTKWEEVDVSYPNSLGVTMHRQMWRKR